MKASKSLKSSSGGYLWNLWGKYFSNPDQYFKQMSVLILPWVGRTQLEMHIGLISYFSQRVPHKHHVYWGSWWMRRWSRDEHCSVPPGHPGSAIWTTQWAGPALAKSNWAGRAGCCPGHDNEHWSLPHPSLAWLCTGKASYRRGSALCLCQKRDSGRARLLTFPATSCGWVSCGALCWPPRHRSEFLSRCLWLVWVKVFSASLQGMPLLVTCCVPVPWAHIFSLRLPGIPGGNGPTIFFL